MRHARVKVYRRNPGKTKRHRKWGRVKAHKRRVNPFAHLMAHRHKKRSKKSSSKRTMSRRRNPRMRNPINVKGLGQMVMQAVLLGGGFIIGRQVVNLVTAGKIFGKQVFTPPVMFTTTLRPFIGAVPIIVGAIGMKKAKSEKAKKFMLGLVAAGGVDIITVIADKVSPGLLSGWIQASPMRGYVNAAPGQRSALPNAAPTMRRLAGIPIRPQMFSGYVNLNGESSFSHQAGSFG